MTKFMLLLLFVLSVVFAEPITPERNTKQPKTQKRSFDLTFRSLYGQDGRYNTLNYGPQFPEPLPQTQSSPASFNYGPLTPISPLVPLGSVRYFANADPYSQSYSPQYAAPNPPTEHVKPITYYNQIPVYLENRIPAPVDRSYQIPQSYPVEGLAPNQPCPIEKPIPVPVDRPIPVPVPQLYPVEKQVQVPIQLPVNKPVPVPYFVPQPYPVEKRIGITVNRPFPYPVKVAVPVLKPYPINVPVPQPIPVPVEKIVHVDRVIDRQYPIEGPYTNEVSQPLSVNGPTPAPFQQAEPCVVPSCLLKKPFENVLKE